MNTDEMLKEIASYKYRSYGFPYVFMDYSQHFKKWSITWRNPANFTNDECRNADTPNQACKIALDFIKNNPMLFSKIGFP